MHIISFIINIVSWKPRAAQRKRVLPSTMISYQYVSSWSFCSGNRLKCWEFSWKTSFLIRTDFRTSWCAKFQHVSCKNSDLCAIHQPWAKEQFRSRYLACSLGQDKLVNFLGIRFLEVSRVINYNDSWMHARKRAETTSMDPQQFILSWDSWKVRGL